MEWNCIAKELVKLLIVGECKCVMRWNFFIGGFFNVVELCV